ncbi:MAG: helix-turn-helix transcriptional regulator [Clostridia bacterium]|nr:helix-turn-helix transcriptional regulator [Clostridia bacterium]
MGRGSVKQNKNIYQVCREERGLTRAAAAELMEWVSESRIEKIESEKSAATPEEIMAMSKAYKYPELRSYYCSHECAIGKKDVKEVEDKPIEKIVLELLSALNKIDAFKNRFIEIASDGIIHDDEIEDFISISNRLDSISSNISSLKLWLDKTIESGNINKEILEKVIDSNNNK